MILYFASKKAVFLSKIRYFTFRKAVFLSRILYFIFGKADILFRILIFFPSSIYFTYHILLSSFYIKPLGNSRTQGVEVFFLCVTLCHLSETLCNNIFKNPLNQRFLKGSAESAFLITSIHFTYCKCPTDNKKICRIIFSIDINALRAILLKSAIINRKIHFPFHILPDYRQAGIINYP